MTAVDYLTRVLNALDKLGVEYMAVGSFSSNVYGYPRSTQDADLVIELGDRPIAALAAEVGADFVLDPRMSFETVTNTLRYHLRHRGTTFLVELFLLSDDPHDRARFSRRVAGDIGGRPMFIPTAEDVVITKLRWARHAKRDKDISDVHGILDVQAGRLNLAYIRHWADLHQTGAVFEELLTEPS